MNVIPRIALPEPQAAERLAFTGDGGAFLRLLIRGGLLLIPTLGFYRFWLVTDIRRHLWGHTRIGDDALEYTGTPRELLLGFLIALAILAPLYVAYFILGLLAEELQAFASIPLVLILYVFGHYAAFRARRYRLTRTAFRGIRFWMTGSAWAYAARAAFWDLATLLTLGLAYPWRAAALERFRMRHTRFGDLSGAFVGSPRAFFGQGWLLWLISVGFLAFGGAGFALIAAGAATPGLGPIFGLVAGVGAVAVPFVFPFLRALEARWRLTGVRFGPVALDSDLAGGRVFKLYLFAVLASLGFSVVGGVAIGIIGSMGADAFASLSEGLPALTPKVVVVVALLVLAYLAFLIGFGVIRQYFLVRGVWAAAVASVAVANLPALDRVTAEGAPASAVGEGLADALDVGAF